MTNAKPVLPQVNTSVLRPYASMLILQTTDVPTAVAFQRLVDFLRSKATTVRNSSATIVANGFPDGTLPVTDGTGDDDRFEEADVFITRRTGAPSWLKADGGYEDTKHELCVVMRRDQLIAVHCDSRLRDALQRWLDSSPPPPLRRVGVDILQGAFLQGEAKGLWLRGTHARRSSRADSKNISGSRLQDALSPFEDSSFAMSSARSSIPDDPTRTALTGIVGTTPRKALLWNKASPSFDDFVRAVHEALSLVASTMTINAGVDRPYPLLAAETLDPSNVGGAYEITVANPLDLPPGTSDDERTAAELLQTAHLSVSGDPTSPNFDLDVGLHGATSGTLRARLVTSLDRSRFDFGLANNPSDPATVRDLRDALSFDDLLTVYFETGHAFMHGAIWHQEIRAVPFPNWEFQDFSGFDVSSEKPPGQASQDIHDSTGLVGDDSLFAWIVQRYRDGWLTCDDGPGEIADFVQVTNAGVVRLIHAKGATSASRNRGVSVGAYEVVTSQASKNLGFLDVEVLRSRLAAPPIASPACWTSGQRVPDRKELIEALKLQSPRVGFEVLIVQPHLRKTMHTHLRSSTSPSSGKDALRLDLLDTLLNSARGAIVGRGAELHVVASAE